MRSMLDYTQLECGCSGNVLEQDCGRYSRVLMTENWITGIWEHLYSCKSTLKIIAEWKPLLNRKNDVVVMEALTETKEFTAKELKKSIDAGYTSEYFTYPTLLLMMGKELQTGQERDGKM
jgi:hypothetical protein